MNVSKLLGKYLCFIGLHRYQEVAKFDRLTVEAVCERCGKHREMFDPNPPTGTIEESDT